MHQLRRPSITTQSTHRDVKEPFATLSGKLCARLGFRTRVSVVSRLSESGSEPWRAVDSRWREVRLREENVLGRGPAGIVVLPITLNVSRAVRALIWAGMAAGTAGVTS